MLLFNSAAIFVELPALGLIRSINAATVDLALLSLLYLFPNHNESLFHCQALILARESENYICSCHGQYALRQFHL